MAKDSDFIKDFQKDHDQILALVDSFKQALSAKDKAKAEQILEKIETTANAHFIFEETYLYPRLRRLVSQITEGLSASHELMRSFIAKAGGLLSDDNLDKTGPLFEDVPKLSKLFDACGSMTFLADKFSEYDKNDLNERYKECSQLNSPGAIKI